MNVNNDYSELLEEDESIEYMESYFEARYLFLKSFKSLLESWLIFLDETSDNKHQENRSRSRSGKSLLVQLDCS